MDRKEKNEDGYISNYLTDTEKFKKGEFLFHEGDQENFIYYISEGKVNIFKSKSVLWGAGQSEFIGISSFFADGEQYRFSAKAASDCTVQKISNDEFKHILLENTSFSRKIMDLLCNRIRLTNARTKNLLQSSSRCRLIREIVQKASDTDSKSIEYTLDELSEVVGVSKRLVRTLISELERKKLLERIKSKLIIHDLSGLKIIANMD